MGEYGFSVLFSMKSDESNEGYLENRNQILEERTCMETEGVISLFQLKKGMRLFDCPCGYGRHSNSLEAKGIDVTGGDINSIHLNRAIARQKRLD